MRVGPRRVGEAIRRNAVRTTFTNEKKEGAPRLDDETPYELRARHQLSPSAKIVSDPPRLVYCDSSL